MALFGDTGLRSLKSELAATEKFIRSGDFADALEKAQGNLFDAVTDTIFSGGGKKTREKNKRIVRNAISKRDRLKSEVADLSEIVDRFNANTAPGVRTQTSALV